MFVDMKTYLIENEDKYWLAVWQHVSISFQALILAMVIGISLGYLAYQLPKIRQLIIGFSQGLRVIPSLGILFILIPVVGVGRVPALIALVVLGLPPILINTLVGLTQVPAELVETGTGLGMTHGQLMRKVSFPLAMPYVLNGIKLALIEIIASATLASYIGAGGLGNLIFTGLGLYRYDLLVLGGGSVAVLSLLSMLGFDLLISRFKFANLS